MKFFFKLIICICLWTIASPTLLTYLALNNAIENKQTITTVLVVGYIVILFGLIIESVIEHSKSKKTTKKILTTEDEKILKAIVEQGKENMKNEN